MPVTGHTSIRPNYKHWFFIGKALSGSLEHEKSLVRLCIYLPNQVPADIKPSTPFALTIMHTYFLSDLHLTPSRPAVIEAFMAFLAGDARSAEKVYLLGDLFEYWIGDDAAALLGADSLLTAMSHLASEVPCFFIAGNRDFLVGEEFSAQSGFDILADESVIDLYGTPTLILHGDSLCTDDVAHQEFRRLIVTNREWRESFLQLEIADRIAAAKQARMESQTHKSEVSMEIMDVTESAVIDAFETHSVRQMIHGHTHRQNRHDYNLSSDTATRWVLGDWHHSSSILKADANGIEIANLPIQA